MKGFSKKGELSRLAINLLLGSLILVLGIIIWLIIRGGFGNEKQQIYDDSQLDLKISQVKKIDDNTLDVTLKRNVGEGEFIGLSFVVNDGRTTEIIKLNTSLLENETGNFSLDFIYINASKIKSISVTPIYINEEGSQVAGEIKDEYVTPNTCSNYCPDGAQCGVNDCGMNCGSGCNSGYLCLNYKCIKQKTSSGGGGGSSGGSSTPTCTDTCESLGYECGTQTVCSTSTNCGTCTTGYECVSGNCSECETHTSSSCYNGDVYWYNSCDQREERRYDCNATQTCSSGTCVNCLSHASSNCSSGDVYWWNSCGQREEIRYDCNSTQTCSSGTCVNCLSHASSNCSSGDVYWWSSCGQREDIRYDCNATQTCSSGTCVNNPVSPPQTGAIIADHNAARDFDIIPECWIQEAKAMFFITYHHTSHGSQIPSGMSYLVNQVNPTLYSYNSFFTDNYDTDLGNGDWPSVTIYDLDHDASLNTAMWSWCGQVEGYTTYESMSSHYLAPAEDLVDSRSITMIYMTGHLDGSGPTGNVYIANNIIRQHVQDIEGILFDFADIESYDIAGNYYPTGSDACEWCTTWCANHPEDCSDLPGCAHSHGLNCVQKGRAFWWMMARMAGWDGTASDACP